VLEMFIKGHDFLPQICLYGLVARCGSRGSGTMAFQKQLKVLIALSGSILFLLLPTASEATTTFYTTQASFNAAAPGAVLLEDFSAAVPVNTIITVPLVLPSGTYTGLAGSPSPNVYVAPPGFTNFGADVGTTTQYILTANGDENITAMFSTQYHAFGFDAFFNGLGPVTLTVFGAGGSTLGQLNIPGDGLDPSTDLADRGYLGVTSDDLIYGFEWNTTDGRTLNTGFTAISVQTSSETPLPAALPLFATGLGALGLLRWRRKRKAKAA